VTEELPPALGRHLPPAWAVEPGLRLRNLVGRAHRQMMPPAMPVLEQMDRMIEVRMVAAVTELGLPDAVATGPRTAADLAAEGDLDADAVFRVLRYLTSKGWFRVAGGGAPARSSRFGLSTTGSLLRADHPDGLRDWVRFAGSDWMSDIWNHAEHTLRTGESATVAATGQPFFDFLDSTPAADALFDGAMRGGSGLQSRLLVDAIDFSRFRRICDVAGGTGRTLTTVLSAAPDAHGVLLERRSVIDRAEVELRGRSVARRIELVEGDMFDAVPAGCDCYLLLAVVHDWDDAAARSVLANVRDQMGLVGRAVVVEAVVPGRSGADFSTMADVLMLVLTGAGRERTREEFGTLFADAGLRVDRETVLPNLFRAFELTVA
jgi:hypothetical protein